MNPQHPDGAPALSPSPATAPLRSGKRRWRFLAGFIVLLAAVVAGWWWFRLHTPAIPPMPADVQNPEVREAIERARSEVLAQPRSAETWGELGMTLQIHQFYPEADSCYAEATHLDPSDPRWPYARGLIALKRDDPDAALPFLRAASATSTMPEIRLVASLLLAEALLERRTLDEAGQLFDQALKREPNNARAAFGLGLVAIAKKDNTATGSLTIARSSPFYRKQATAQLAALARSRDDPSAAELEKEVASLPDDPPWPDPFIQQLIRRRVGRPTGDTEAEALERQQQFAAAADVFLHQIEINPTSRANIGAGLNLARTGQFERALPLLREAIRLDPDNYKAHFALVRVLAAWAEKESKSLPIATPVAEWYREVIKHARRATELKPDLAQAYLFWGIALKALGEPSAALIPLRQGVAASPLDIDLQVTLGEILADLGENEEARKVVENARLLDPKDPRLAAILARLPTKKP